MCINDSQESNCQFFAEVAVDERDSCKCGKQKCKYWGGKCPYLMPQMYNYPNMYYGSPMNYFGGFGGFNPMMYGGGYGSMMYGGGYSPVMAEDDDDEMVSNMGYSYYHRPRPHYYHRPRPHYWPYYHHHGYHPYSRDEYDED